MSRSYKKSPVYTDGSAGSTKKSKRIANHVIRRTDFEELPLKGGAYRKHFCSYNIHDFITRWTWEEVIAWWEQNDWVRERYPSKKDLYRYWRKNYRNK